MDARRRRLPAMLRCTLARLFTVLFTGHHRNTRVCPCPCIAAAFTLYATSIIDILPAATIVVAIMLFTGCMSPEQARRSIRWVSWRAWPAQARLSVVSSAYGRRMVVCWGWSCTSAWLGCNEPQIHPSTQPLAPFLWQDVYLMIAGSFGVSAALEQSGGAAAIANLIVEIGKNAGGGNFTIAAVYIATTLISQIIANNSAAALMFPIAATISTNDGVDVSRCCRRASQSLAAQPCHVLCSFRRHKPAARGLA
jgi:di/tricarboxylate transporter